MSLPSIPDNQAPVNDPRATLPEFPPGQVPPGHRFGRERRRPFPGPFPPGPFPDDEFPPFSSEPMPAEQLNVGIVGGGIAGLYAALLLQREGHLVRIFEGTDRTGGRVHTHYFSQEANQYYEAGAMRVPESQFHQITIDLVDYVNMCAPEELAVRRIPYVLSSPGNDVHVNGTKHAEVSAASITPAQTNWPDIPAEFKDKRAEDLMMAAIGPLIKALEDDFDKGFENLLQYDRFSFRFYLESVAGYPTSVIDFMETVLSQTNQFALSVTELVMQNMDFDTKDWWTIDRGMSRLTNLMAYLVGYENITFGARVTGVQPEVDGGVTVSAVGYNGALNATFDHKEMAIRSMHFEPLYKMGLRFRTRFWEKIQSRKPSEGGQSTTDSPIRWVVFPSNGIGSEGPGVLLVYAWMTDATTWLPLTAIERRSLAIQCIARLYDGQMFEGEPLKVHDLLIGTADATWSASTATGDAMFLPGQFKTRFEPARRPEGDVYFAGEHISRHHTWIAGAADSALYTVRLMLQDEDLAPLKTFSFESTMDLPLVIGARDKDKAIPNIKFQFRTVFNRGLGGESGDEGKYPLDLGMDGVHTFGARMVSLDAPQSMVRVGYY
ncbi:hypothetical protein B0H10DRAFT_2226466 [Mycena sp. CBHHK59/15]|nr:hypothetical protein B0H10DRAFT_2226466 [Mycena sp. CBHHK59/15]